MPKFLESFLCALFSIFVAVVAIGAIVGLFLLGIELVDKGHPLVVMGIFGSLLFCGCWFFVHQTLE